MIVDAFVLSFLIIHRHKQLKTLSSEEVEKYIAEIEKENEIEAEKKKQAKQIGGTTTAPPTLTTQTSKKE
jgi:hypothetical protein